METDEIFWKQSVVENLNRERKREGVLHCAGAKHGKLEHGP
jgi:hypothetical protein